MEDKQLHCLCIDNAVSIRTSLVFIFKEKNIAAVALELSAVFIKRYENYCTALVLIRIHFRISLVMGIFIGLRYNHK